jgi:hypothetical protein
MFTVSRSTARLLVIVPFAALLAACEHRDPVSPGPLATITVTPNPQTLAINANQPFVATGRDADGNLVPITPVWSVVASGGAINSGSGLFTAGAVTGTFASTVQATSGGISGFATVTVTAPGVLATITVTPNPATMNPNGSQQFTAVGADVRGVVVPITPTPVAWSVVAGGGTINSSSGLFTAGATLGTFNSTVRACNSTGFVCGFATVTVANIPPVGFPILGRAATYGILAGSTVTCAGAPGTINADVGVSPGSTTTGFPPCTITGATNLANAVAANAQNDLTTAYNALAGLPCGTTVTPADLGGRTLAPGVYCAATSMAITGTVTLDGQGNPNALFVFQMGSTLLPATGSTVALIGGAQAKNVYWQVGSSATLGTGTTFRGTIVALTSITLNDNVAMTGRALARNGAVSLGTGDTITLP